MPRSSHHCPVLSTEDDRERVSLALLHPIYGSGTDGELAELCGVSVGYVRRVRAHVTRGEAVRSLMQMAREQQHREGVEDLDVVTFLRLMVRDRQRNATSTERRDRAVEAALHQSRGPARRSGAGPNSPLAPTEKELRVEQPAGLAGRDAGGETHRERSCASARGSTRRCNWGPPGVRKRPDPVAGT